MNNHKDYERVLISRIALFCLNFEYGENVSDEQYLKELRSLMTDVSNLIIVKEVEIEARNFLS